MSETKTKNLCTVPAADLTDSQYFIAEDGGELKRIPKAQVVLKKLEKMLATDTENLAGGGEVTAQELLDALAEQVANKLLAKSQVVNNLLATVEGNPLDATQGKALKELIDTTNNNLSKCVKVNPAVVRSVEFSNGYPAGRYFDISVQQLNDQSSATLNVNKDTIKVSTYKNGAWTDIYTLATKSDLSSSQNLPYVVTCTNAIDQSLFSKAQFKARRTENGTGAAAYGFENVGVNSGALYLDPSDYKLHFINYDGKKFIINWTAEN